MQLAKDADEIIAKTPRSELPPLIGLPVSIKDHITVANVPRTLGFTSCHNLVKKFDSLIVSILRKKGVLLLLNRIFPKQYLQLNLQII